MSGWHAVRGMKVWFLAVVIPIVISLPGCDTSSEPTPVEIGQVTFEFDSELEAVAARGEVKEATVRVLDRVGNPIPGVDLWVTLGEHPGGSQPDFSFGSTPSAFAPTASMVTASNGEAQVFIRYPSPERDGKILVMDSVSFKATIPEFGREVLTDRITVYFLPFGYTPTYLGDFEPVAINDRSQVLAYELSGDGRTAVVIDSDGAVHRMPSLGEQVQATSIGGSGTVVGATASGTAIKWQPGSDPEVLGTIRTAPEPGAVWISSNGLILADTILWRDGVPERLPEEPDGIRWKLVNARGEVGGTAGSSGWVWDGIENHFLGVPTGAQYRWEDFADSGEILLYAYQCCSIDRPIHQDERDGPWVPRKISPVSGGADAARINSIGTMVSFWSGRRLDNYNETDWELRIQHGGEASLSQYLVVGGYSFSTHCNCFAINRLGEIAVYATINDQDGAFLLRPTDGYPGG